MFILGVKNNLNLPYDVQYDSSFMDNTANNFFQTMYGFLTKLDLLFLLMAMVGLVFLVASSSVKQGSWKKTGYGLLLGSYGSLLLIKGLPLFMEQFSQVDILTESVEVASYVLLLWATINLCMSFSYRLGYNLIEHVEYLRLAKNTFLLSSVVIIAVFFISFIV